MKTNALLFTALLFIAGCQSKNKSSELPIEKPASIENLPVTLTGTPDNKDNPYDSVGRIHNEVLEATHQYIMGGGDTTNAGIKQFIGQYFREYRHADVTKALINIPDSLPQILLKDYRQVVFARKMTPLTTSFLRQIFDTISKTESLNYPSFKSKIVAIEQEIQSESRLSEVDKRMLLCTTSLARHSGYYWVKVLNKHTSQTLRGKGLLHILKRIVAFICCCIGDASGAIYAYATEPEAIIADASFLSTATWGGMTYYGNW